jgi:hypothetical protein
MAEYLSRSERHPGLRGDWLASQWLKNDYILPLHGIERNDGIIVENMHDMAHIIQAHERYMEIRPMPNNLPPQTLWVPGLEPTYTTSEGMVRSEPRAGKLVNQDIFSGSEVCLGPGGRRGTLVRTVRCPRGWEREIWKLPTPKRQKVIENDGRKRKDNFGKEKKKNQVRL